MTITMYGAGAVPPSMPPDADTGRPLEIDVLVGAATINTSLLPGLARLYAHSHGLYPPQ